MRTLDRVLERCDNTRISSTSRLNARCKSHSGRPHKIYHLPPRPNSEIEWVCWKMAIVVIHFEGKSACVDKTHRISGSLCILTYSLLYKQPRLMNRVGTKSRKCLERGQFQPEAKKRLACRVLSPLSSPPAPHCRIQHSAMEFRLESNENTPD